MPTNQSPQSQAINTANGYLTAAERVLSLYAQLKELAAQWSDDSVANTLSQLHTVSIGLDGSIGTVSDPVINTNNPINPLLYTNLTRPISVFQLAQLKTILDGLVSYVDGQAVTTQPGARSVLHGVTGGN